MKCSFQQHNVKIQEAAFKLIGSVKKQNPKTNKKTPAEALLNCSC